MWCGDISLTRRPTILRDRWRMRTNVRALWNYSFLLKQSWGLGCTIVCGLALSHPIILYYILHVFRFYSNYNLIPRHLLLFWWHLQTYSLLLLLYSYSIPFHPPPFYSTPFHSFPLCRTVLCRHDPRELACDERFHLCSCRHGAAELCRLSRRNDCRCTRQR